MAKAPGRLSAISGFSRRRASNQFALGLHPIGKAQPMAYGHSCSDGKYVPSKLKETFMYLLFEPVLASVYYIGGGFGLVALIVIIVLILR